MQYSIKLIRSYTINYNSTWNHVLQRRSGGDITITQNNDTGFYVKFIGNSKGIEQYYTSNLSEYVVRQLPTFGEDKQKLETRLFTFIDKIRSEAVPLHFRAIDDEINRLNIAKANCIKMFGLDIAPW